MPMLRAADMHELRLAHETANMIVSAEMKLKASIMRTESRCSHYRLDYPDMDDQNWRAWINIYKGSDGNMKLEKQPFDQSGRHETSIIGALPASPESQKDGHNVITIGCGA